MGHKKTAKEIQYSSNTLYLRDPRIVIIFVIQYVHDVPSAVIFLMQLLLAETQNEWASLLGLTFGIFYQCQLNHVKQQ